MNLSSIEKTISYKRLNLKRSEYNKHFLEEIKKCLINNIYIKVNMDDVIYLINLNYEVNKRLLDDYLVKLINQNKINKYQLLEKLSNC